MTELSFNQFSPKIIYIDFNSCFATVEQQANPLYRGKPIAVAAYDTPNGCILAPSIEAKKLGIKVGMRVKDGRALCPGLIILKPDLWKYRNVHIKLRKLLGNYSPDITPKSIDEFILDMGNSPVLKTKNIKEVAKEIKSRIKLQIGDYLTVSIGISTNRLLAKLASNLKKPDGLVEINKNNFEDVYRKLELTDIPYIKIGNSTRLNSVGIFSVWQFYKSPLWKLKAAFASINGYYWYMRLRGWEVDSVPFDRKSYGNSYAIPKPLSTPSELAPILSKLVTKMCSRFRKAGYKIGGVHLAISFRDGTFWHRGIKLSEVIFTDQDVYRAIFRLLTLRPDQKPVRDLSVSSFNLVKNGILQLNLFQDVEKKVNLAKSVDMINERWGNFTITSGRMISVASAVPDRIAFGGVKELEEFVNI